MQKAVAENVLVNVIKSHSTMGHSKEVPDGGIKPREKACQATCLAHSSLEYHVAQPGIGGCHGKYLVELNESVNLGPGGSLLDLGGQCLMLYCRGSLMT